MKKLFLLVALCLALPVLAQNSYDSMLQYNLDPCLQDILFCTNKSFEYNVIKEMESGKIPRGGITAEGEKRKHDIYNQCLDFYIMHYNNWESGDYKPLNGIIYIAK